jgi:hypothetical protein
MKKLLFVVFALIPAILFSQTRSEGLQSITAGTATTLNDDVSIVKVNPASTLASHTITMPANPADRQEIYIFFGGTLTSGTIVTALTIAANTGQGLVQISAPSKGVFGDILSYWYDRASQKWYRKATQTYQEVIDLHNSQGCYSGWSWTGNVIPTSKGGGPGWRRLRSIPEKVQRIGLRLHLVDRFSLCSLGRSYRHPVGPDGSAGRPRRQTGGRRRPYRDRGADANKRRYYPAKGGSLD